MVGETSCVEAEVTKGELGDCRARPSPAGGRRIRAGDVVVKVGDTQVADFDEMVSAVRKLDRSDQFTVRARRDRVHHGRRRHPGEALGRRRRHRAQQRRHRRRQRRARFGPTQYNPLSAVPATFAFTGDLAVEMGKSLAKIPTKVGALVHSIGGGERDPETPMSVVGASIIGGDTVEARAVGGVLVLPGPAELRARRDQPDSAVAVRRWPHRDRRIREDPQYDSATRGMVAAAPSTTSS